MDFKNYLEQQMKSDNTIKSYVLNINEYKKWYYDSFGSECKNLYRINILDYISFLKNISKNGPRTINSKISALIKYNQFLINIALQEERVIFKNDMIKIQQEIASPSNISKNEVEEFRQKILSYGSRRDYAIVTIMAYAGLRISEVLNLKIEDCNLVSREIVVQSGKGKKYRVVFINGKICNALREYLTCRQSNSDYIFVSRQSERVDRTRINQIFNKHSNKITPHALRHFYCTNALESGYSVHEVANQAGHSNIHTTLLYTNPTRSKMKEKANLL